MDMLLTLTRTESALGFDGPGDVFMGADKALTFRRQAPGAKTAPYAYIGLHITKPTPVYDWPGDSFGLVDLWLEKARAGLVKGMVLDGQWMHVGDPAARDAAAALLQEHANR
jgi:MurNAc alpha-1-phosphate uridylyltransferase